LPWYGYGMEEGREREWCELASKLSKLEVNAVDD